MKNIIKAIRVIVYPLLGISIIYLPMAFYNITFDLHMWTESSRSFVSIFATFFFVVGLAIAILQNMYKQEN